MAHYLSVFYLQINSPIEVIISTDGWDGRDPMVVNLGPNFNNTWAISCDNIRLFIFIDFSCMYYCATDPDSGNSNVNHVTKMRTSTDLYHWSSSQIVFNGGTTGSASGGRYITYFPSYSPLISRRTHGISFCCSTRKQFLSFFWFLG